MAFRLSPEIVSGEESYVTDIANPDRIQEWPLTLALIAYASQNGRLIGVETIDLLSERSQTDQSKLVALFADAKLAPDAMGSFMHFEGDAGWLSVLSSSTVEMISSFGSPSNLIEAAAHVGTGDENDGWLVLHAVIRDFPIPLELRESTREAVLNVDLVALSEKNDHVGILATAFAAQHAAHLGIDVVDKIRKELLALAGAFAEKERRAPTNGDDSKGALLSAAFYLYSRGPCANRYGAIAELLEDLVIRWPGLAPHCRKMVDLLVDGLPNMESRLLWQLQVKLRAI